MRACGLLLSIACLLPGCGGTLEAFEVTLRPTSRCTVTGGTSLDCTDPATLQTQSIRGRWWVEHSPQRTFSLTMERGQSLVGISFLNDGLTLAEPPCTGEGGTCLFARRRFESIDANTGCTRTGELVAILRRDKDDTIVGVVSDAAAADERCGTSTQVVRQDSVEGLLSDEYEDEDEASEGDAP